MTDDDVLPHVRDRVAGFTPAGAPVRLPGGNLNFVWRVPGEQRSLIVKYAPPYIAVDPDTPLDPSRIEIEARCLQALGPDGSLSDLPGQSVRPPRVVDFCVSDHVLIMEDVGDLPSVDEGLRAYDEEEEGAHGVATVGRRLGRFIGDLHRETHDDPSYAQSFDNQAMQETRHAVQYQGVTGMLETGRVSDAQVLGERAEALGERLQEDGECLTMGDLWPPSVLVANDQIRLIDWELAHYGRPLQDVAHWGAHLWMQAQRAPSADVTTVVERLWASFIEAYRERLGDTEEGLWPKEELRDAALHVGAEILVRAVGPFQEGYVYAGLDPDHSAVQEAVTTAARYLRRPHDTNLLSGTLP